MTRQQTALNDFSGVFDDYGNVIEPTIEEKDEAAWAQADAEYDQMQEEN